MSSRNQYEKEHYIRWLQSVYIKWSSPWIFPAADYSSARASWASLSGKPFCLRIGSEWSQALWLAKLSCFLIGWAGNPGLWDSQHRRAAIPRTYHESNLAPTVNSGFKTKSHSNFGNPDTQSEVWKWDVYLLQTQIWYLQLLTFAW